MLEINLSTGSKKPVADKTISLLHFDGSWKDEANINRIWTPTGAVTQSDINPKFGSRSYSNVAAGAAISTDDEMLFRLTTDFTIDFWFYNLGISGQNNGQVLYQKWSSTGGHMLDVSNGAMGLYDLSTGAPIVEVAAAQMIYNAWAHWEISRQGNVFRIFLNGELKAQATNATTSLFANNHAVRIGNYSNGNNPPNGRLDEFRVSRVCRHSANFIPAIGQYILD